MKRAFLIILSLILVLTLSFSLIACGNKGDTDTDTSSTTDSEVGTSDTDAGSSDTDAGTSDTNAGTSDTDVGASDTETDTDSENNGENEEQKPVHTHVEEMVKGKAATCTETGLTDGKKCSECGEIIIEQTVIPLIAHSLKSVEAQVPTCNDIGWDAYEKCTKCNYTTYKELPKSKIHETRTEKLATMGDCGSGYLANVCDICGDYEMAHLDLVCNVELSSEGNTLTIECRDCALAISFTSKTELSCEFEASAVVTYDGEELFTGDSYEYNSHENVDYDLIDLSDVFACGARAVVLKCFDCDKVMELCAAEHEGELNVDKTTEGDAIVKTSICDTCSFKKIETTWTENDCQKTSVKELELYKGETLLYKSKKETPNRLHTFEAEYIMLGDSCDNGYAKKDTCVSCGKTEYDFGFGCVDGKTEFISLEGISSCGGGYLVEKCLVCKNVSDNAYFTTECIPVDEDREETDENGNTVVINTVTCYDCGIVYEYIHHDVSEFDCANNYYFWYKLYMGDTVFFEYDRISEDEDYYHSPVYNYKLLGESCRDGVLVTETCEFGCGYKDEYIVYYHTANENDAKKIENFACEGTVLSEEICLCGTETNYYLYPCYGAEYDYNYGDSYQKTTITCPDCNLQYINEIVYELALCKSIGKGTITLIVGETAYYDNESYINYVYEYHDYEDEEIMFGDSCYDGYLVVSTCKDCGDVDYYYDDYHDTENIETTTIPSACGDIEIVHSVCHCGEREDYDYWLDGCTAPLEKTIMTDENGFINNYYTRTCESCGIKINEDIIETKGEGCTSVDTKYLTFIYKDENGEEKTLEYIYNLGSNEHHNYKYTYEILGNSCYDVVRETKTCVDCGDTYVDENSGSHSPREDYGYDIRFDYYGSKCGGWYRYSICPCEEAVPSFSLSTYGCDMVSTTTSEEIDGVLYTTKTDTCQNCGLVIIAVSNEETIGCYTYEYIVRTIKMGERVIVDSQNETHLKEENHDNTVEYKLEGESCDDGWIEKKTCKDCGKVTMFWSYSHDYVCIIDSDMLAGQICDEHYFEIKTCLCGEYSDFDGITISDYIEENNGVYSCDVCNLVITKAISETVNADCTMTYVETYSVTVGGEEKFLKAGTQIFEKHDFELVGSSKVDGNLVIETACKKCDLAFTSEIKTTGEFIEGYFGNEYQFKFTPEETGYYSLYVLGNEGSLYTAVYDKTGELIDLRGTDSAVLPIELEAGKTYTISYGDWPGTDAFEYVFLKGNMPVTYEIAKESADYEVTVDGTTYNVQISKDCGAVLSYQEAVLE